MIRALLIYTLSLSIFSCSNIARASNPSVFRNSDGETISLTNHAAVIHGKEYLGRDCSSEFMLCVDYAGYFSIITPKKCTSLKLKAWKASNYSTTQLGVDHHHFASMYGVNHGEMVAYTYLWDGGGVIGLMFDAIHKLADPKELDRIGYRDPSFFYDKISGDPFMACSP